jgi:polycystin 1
LQHLDLATNPVALIMCSVVFGLWLAVVVVCRYFDKVDLRRISTVPLCGKDGSFKYEITVMTARQRGSGMWSMQGKILEFSIRGGGVVHMCS